MFTIYGAGAEPVRPVRCFVTPVNVSRIRGKGDNDLLTIYIQLGWTAIIAESSLSNVRHSHAL